jgi:hypothetical protein
MKNLTPSELAELVSLKDAAYMSGVPYATLFMRAKRGKLKVVRVFGRVLITRKVLVELLRRS